MRIRFDKVDGIIRIYDRTRYLVLFGAEKYDTIYNRMRYLVSLKSSITCFFSVLRKNQSRFLWSFAYEKNIDVTCCDTP